MVYEIIVMGTLRTYEYLSKHVVDVFQAVQANHLLHDSELWSLGRTDPHPGANLIKLLLLRRRPAGLIS